MPDAHNRRERITIRLSREELSALRGFAAAAGLDLAPAARSAMLAGIASRGADTARGALAAEITDAVTGALVAEWRAYARGLREKFLPRVVAAAGGRIQPDSSVESGH